MEQAWENENYRKIMNSASSPFLSLMGPEELESLQMITLWNALRKYNPSYGTKFTSYLYDQMRCALLTVCKKRKKRIKCINVGTEIDMEFFMKPYDNSAVNIISELKSQLTEEEFDLLNKRFIERKYLKEIAQDLHCTVNSVKTKIEKVLRKSRRLI